MHQLKYLKQWLILGRMVHHFHYSCKDFRHLTFCANVKIIRLALKIPELHPDNAAVNTTKLINPAANVIPIFANVATNGLPISPN